MPRNFSKTKNSAKGHQTRKRQSVKSPHVVEHHRAVPTQIESAQARHTGRLAGKVAAELVRPVVRNTGIRASAADGRNRTGLLDAAARITGGVLAVTATLVAEPILFVLEALTMRRGRRAGRSPGTKGDDLKSREYRDNTGQTHHHTRTFMRDHAGELRALPA
jgi:hypothetical protein